MSDRIVSLILMIAALTLAVFVIFEMTVRLRCAMWYWDDPYYLMYLCTWI